MVKYPYNRLKAVMVAPDVCTILYFYLHERMRIPVDCASVIIAAYSGLIIYFLGKTVSDRLNADQGLTVDSERREVEAEIVLYRR